jgi:hypothetical protein
MNDLIYYKGTPQEYAMLNCKQPIQYAKKASKPKVKKYSLYYGGKPILSNKDYDKCVAKREYLKITQAFNYSLQKFKIK